MKTVFTNGCFDILHVGHVRYLTEARALGDRLIVGLNSDASVRALKGPNRPINSHEARREMLLALRCVDEVVIFDEQDPCALIERLRPDVHVKGGDYRPEDLPEAAIVQAYGGEVVILSYHAGYSTTGLVAAIQDEGSV